MKQQTNNEIDLLLRRLSRRDAASTPDAGHLDADELNSYAENALPAAARARYTEHLAECSRCRELVVQLSSAAGVVVAEEPSRVAAPSVLRKFLASLFSPMVLRYAVPAIGLMVVAVIGFSVFRREGGNNSPPMVATSRQAETPAVAQQTKPEVMFDDQAKSGSVSPTPELRRQRNEAEPPAPTPPAANVQAGDIKEAPADKTASKAVATAAPPPAAPKPEETSNEGRKKDAEEQKQETQDRAAATPQTERNKVFQSERETMVGAAAARRPAKRATSQAAEDQGAGAAAGARAESRPVTLGKDRDDADTRTVEGRRFRKQRGIWVDTAYADGPTIDLTRGSEQYRGLVADEPQIKKIADQLDGQIIVVWKGQAYHIR